MAFSKDYYQSKLEGIVEQVNKLVQKNTNNQYEFVKEHSELVQKYNEIAKILQQEEQPKEAEQKTPPTKVKSK